MTRKEIIIEFDKAKINFDYANNKDNGYSADWINEDFSSVIDLVEELVNKNSVLANVSKCSECNDDMTQDVSHFCCDCYLANN